MSFSPEQCRAARAWLGWTQKRLAEEASVSLSTIKDFEGGNRTPIANNLEAIKRALEGAGMKMEFEDGRPTGVTYTGHAGVTKDQAAR